MDGAGHGSTMRPWSIAAESGEREFGDSSVIAEQRCRRTIRETDVASGASGSVPVIAGSGPSPVDDSHLATCREVGLVIVCASQVDLRSGLVQLGDSPRS